MVLRSPQFFYVHKGKLNLEKFNSSIFLLALVVISVWSSASGLNMMDDTFAFLPPHWNPTSTTLSSVKLNEVIAGYSSLDSSFQVVVEFLLASVIFHAVWIKNNYPSGHPIFNTRFWTNNYHIKYRRRIISGKYYQ